MDDNRINQLKRFLLQVKGRYLASTDSSSDRTTVLDRITALGCESLLLENYEVLKMALDALDSLYRSHLDRPTSTQGSGSESPARWLEIISRVHVIGALAVRTAAWEAVPELVFHRIGDDTYSYQSWLRHALTEAARSNLLNGDTNRARGGLTLAWARELIAHRPDLRPDILQAEVPVLEGNDPLLDSLCQWDFLWCCIALSGGKGSSHEFYPSCAAFHGYRAEPIIDTLDSREDVRHELFDNADDETVASSIANVISMAERESWNYGGYWAGSSHLSPTGFIRTNAVIT
ncbi:hypothetical protein [Microbacterium sp. A93]|uniref:hypothetical protein n=1 Tax=Microbacterium sp. A93 TaxID=3450716 RepID=UPI003F4397AB